MPTPKIGELLNILIDICHKSFLSRPLMSEKLNRFKHLCLTKSLNINSKIIQTVQNKTIKITFLLALLKESIPPIAAIKDNQALRVRVSVKLINESKKVNNVKKLNQPFLRDIKKVKMIKENGNRYVARLFGVVKDAVIRPGTFPTSHIQCLFLMKSK